MPPVALTSRNVRNLAGMAASVPWPPNARVLARNAVSLRRDRPWRNCAPRDPAAAVRQLATPAIEWICRSQDRVGSGGVGDFRFQGWTPGYPEVTGYIIPTVYDYAEILGRPELRDRARRMADWELGIQQPGGGFESWYEGEGRPPVVFNTGQVIRGLVRTGTETGEERYIDGARRAADWIISGQGSDGSFEEGNYLGMKVVYDVYATAALAQLGRATGEQRYVAAAVANAEFAVSNQNEAGWFDRCNNVPTGNDAPSTHTLNYTADGLIEIGLISGETRLLEAGERAALAMMDLVSEDGRLPGRFDSEWRPRAESVVLTGSAQLGDILAGISERSGDAQPLEVSWRLLDFLAYVQELNSVGVNRTGAIAGSYPVWGRYVPLKYPSWATKFYLDHIGRLTATAQARSTAA